MAPYSSIFAGALVVNVAATLRSSSYWNKCKHQFGFSPETGESSEEVKPQEASLKKELDAKHYSVLKRYLVVYLLAVLSDWLQGPYVYALYETYGYSQHNIAILFVAGFGSSMIVGSFIGGLADSCGRRKFTILFAIIYAASCATKHFKNFKVLMLGRLLGGVATSLLFSTFDSWLIKAHAQAGVSSYLAKSFSIASYGNSTIAILAGLFANKVASMNELKPAFDPIPQRATFFMGGYLNPFDMALVALSLCGIFAALLWDENYGIDNRDDSDKKEVSLYGGFKNAFFTTYNSTDILLTGIICSLFEGSMYIFVFMWTPAMTNLTEGAAAGSLPFGLIFSTFMVCSMAGSSLFSICVELVNCEKIGLGVFSSATVSFLFMALSNSDTLTFLSFLLFEICVGCYFPMMGTMKSIIVPERKRAAIYNLYRIPLNLIVVMSLLTHLTPKQSFFLCTTMMGIATWLQVKLIRYQKTSMILHSSSAPPVISSDVEEFYKTLDSVVEEEESLAEPFISQV